MALLHWPAIDGMLQPADPAPVEADTDRAAGGVTAVGGGGGIVDAGAGAGTVAAGAGGAATGGRDGGSGAPSTGGRLRVA